MSNLVFACLLDSRLILRWALSLAAAKEIDKYLIFLGASGLLLTFLMWAAFFFCFEFEVRLTACAMFSLFFEIYGKDVLLTRVWFELLWVGLFCIMNLGMQSHSYLEEFK